MFSPLFSFEKLVAEPNSNRIFQLDKIGASPMFLCGVEVAGGGDDVVGTDI